MLWPVLINIKPSAFRKANKSSLLRALTWITLDTLFSLASLTQLSEIMGSSTMATVREIRRSQRAEGSAAVLAIGTANPPYSVSQEQYPDYYFRVTKSQHLTADLKHKLKTMCEMTGTEKRFFHHTQELLDAYPHFLDGGQPSLHDRLEIVATAAPELAASAATKAIAKWGRPATDITHLILSTNSCARAPGADLRLASLLGLRPTVVRTLLQLNGCAAGSASLRLAKDLAENNRGARVQVACVELTIVAFQEPEYNYPHSLASQASFGDGTITTSILRRKLTQATELVNTVALMIGIPNSYLLRSVPGIG